MVCYSKTDLASNFTIGLEYHYGVVLYLLGSSEYIRNGSSHDIMLLKCCVKIHRGAHMVGSSFS